MSRDFGSDQSISYQSPVVGASGDVVTLHIAVTQDGNAINNIDLATLDIAAKAFFDSFTLPDPDQYGHGSKMYSSLYYDSDWVS